MTTATARRDFHNIGETLPPVRSGRYTITLQWIREGVYRVETRSTGGIIDAWSCSYPDEEVARTEALRTVAVFAPTGTYPNGPTVDQVAGLRDMFDAQVEANLLRRHPDATARAIAYEKLRDAITPLTVSAHRAVLAVDVLTTAREAA